MRRIIIILILILLSTQSIFASKVSDFFKGDSQKKRNNKANLMLETLINDGSVNIKSENENWTNIIGSTADNVLISIKEAINPIIYNITGSNDNKEFIKINKTSYIGTLIYILIILECIFISIQSFIYESLKFKKVVTNIIELILLLVFITFLPLICDGILNIFTSFGITLGNGKIPENNLSNKLYAYMPSDCLKTLNICKEMLSIEHIRIGGYELSTLVPHIIINIGEFIVTIPFLILTILIVFWYCEMYLIFVAGCISLPFSFFSQTKITSYRNIIKAMLMQGVKITIGIFLSSFIKEIIISSLKKIDSNFTSTIHIVLFTIFLTIIIFFVITKGTSVIFNAFNGRENDNKSPLFLAGGVFASAVGSTIGSASNMFNKNNRSIPQINLNPKIPQTNIQSHDQNHKTKQEQNTNSTKNNVEYQKINNKTKSKNTSDYGEVTARATKDRIEAAKLEFQNEGITNYSDKDLIEKAKNDAIIAKLVKMEKNNFLTKDGLYNKPAAEQLKRLRNANK